MVLETLETRGDPRGATAISEILGRKVEKGYLQNLDDGTIRTFLTNPEGFEEAYEAMYVRHPSPGLSHEPLQYMGNKNARIPLTLIFDQLIFNEQKGRVARRNVGGDRNDVRPVNDVEQWRRFLLSLLYPRRGQRLANSAPPAVLFSWPGMISMRVRIMKIRFRHLQFKSGRPLPRIMTANIEMEEDPLERMYSGDMITYGTLRPWASNRRARRLV